MTDDPRGPRRTDLSRRAAATHRYELTRVGPGGFERSHRDG
jgi:hypothetical protein